MKLIIAGSRTIREVEAGIQWAFGEDAHWKVTHVVSGGQVSTDADTGEKFGADYLGQQWAAKHGIPVTLMLADWNQYGKSAGPRRNTDMAAVADVALVVWDGKSRGSKDMILKMKSLCKPCWVYMAHNPEASTLYEQKERQESPAENRSLEARGTPDRNDGVQDLF